VFLQQNTPVQIWISGNLRCQRVRNVRSLKWNRIGRRITMCMLLIAALALILNLLGESHLNDRPPDEGESRKKGPPCCRHTLPEAFGFVPIST
jgi:hypothetical protein